VALLLGFPAAWWLATESINSIEPQIWMRPPPAMEAMSLPSPG